MFLAVVVTGILWTILILRLTKGLRREFRDIRAVHFGSLFSVPWFLGISCAFKRFRVPALYQAAFPLRLGLLVALSGIGYMMPRDPRLEAFILGRAVNR